MALVLVLVWSKFLVQVCWSVPLSSVGQQTLSSVGQQPLSSVGQQPLSSVGQQPLSSVGQQPLSSVGHTTLCGYLNWLVWYVVRFKVKLW
jgi:hypothetical protein